MNVTIPRITTGFLTVLLFVFSLLSGAQSFAATIAFQQGSESIFPGQTVILEVTDPDPTTNPGALFRWFEVSGSGATQVPGEFGSTFSPNITGPGTFTYRANVLVPGGVDEESNTFSIVVAYVPPTVTIDGIFVAGTNNGSSQANAFSGDTIKIESTGIDPDGGSVTYSWSADAGAPSLFDPSNPNNIAATNGQDYEFLAPVVTVPTQLQLTVLVTDNESGNDQGTISKTVIVTVRPKETPVSVPEFTNTNDSAITGPIFFDPIGDTLKINGLQSSDPDGGAIAAYLWTPVGNAPAVTATDGNPQIVNIPAITATTAISYDLEVTDDEGEKSGNIRATVLLEPFRQPVITITGPTNFTIFSDQTVNMVLNSIVDPDPDGGPVTVNPWVQTGATGGTLDQTNRQSVVFTPPNPLNLLTSENSKVFTFTVNATDDDKKQDGTTAVSNSTSEDAVFTVTVLDRGRLPTANFEVTLPTADANGDFLEDRVLRLEADLGAAPAGDTAPNTVTNGSQSNHPACNGQPSGGISSFVWTTVSGASVTPILPSSFGIVDSNGSQFWFKARVPSPSADVAVKLTVTDCQGQVASKTIPITIIDDGNNEAPVAEAGNDLSVVPGATITLNGANSTDPDGNGDIETYKWEQTSGPDVGITNSDQPVATATAPNQDATLRFKLTLTDKSGATGTDELIVNVSETNVPPTAVATATPALVAFGATVALNGDQSTDPEGGNLSYSWTTQTPGITIDAFSSANTTATMPSTQQGVEFQLEVTDDQGAKSTARTIVNVGSGQPPTVNAGADKTVKEGELVRLIGSAVDPDGTDSAINYLWRLAGGLNVTLDNPATAEPQFLAPFVLQTKSTTFELVVTDESGFKAVDSVTITIEDNGITGFEDGFVTRTPIVEDNIVGTPRPIGFKVTGGELVFLRPVPVEDFGSTEGKPSELPFGLWEYRIKGANPSLEIQFSGGAGTSTRWFNFNNNSWSEFKDEDGGVATFDDRRDIVTLQLRDGGGTDQGGTTTDGFVTGTGGLGSTTGTTTQTVGGRSQLGGGGSLGLPLLLTTLLGLRRYRLQVKR